MAEETIGGNTKEQWEQDLMRMREVIDYHYAVADKAKKLNKPNIEARAREHSEALCSIYALAEYVIKEYPWKGTPQKAVQ